MKRKELKCVFERNLEGLLETVQDTKGDNKYSIITLCNRSFEPLARNWNWYLNRLNLNNYLTITTNRDTFKSLNYSEIKTFFLNVEGAFSDKSENFGTKNFSDLTFLKPLLTRYLIHEDMTFLFSDVDTIWLKNPAPHFDDVSDIQMQTDNPDYFTVEEILLNAKKEYGLVNTGFFLISPTRQSKIFLDKWINGMVSNPHLDDQSVFNSILSEENITPYSDIRLKKTIEPLNIKLLDPLLFPNGSIYFKKNKGYSQYNASPAVMHVNWARGLEGKINLLKKFNLLRT